MIQNKQKQTNKNQNYSCGICYNSKPNLITMKECSHSYCQDCIKMNIKSGLQKMLNIQDVVKCPEEGCQSKLDFQAFIMLYKLYYILDKFMDSEVILGIKQSPDYSQYKMLICKKSKCSRIFVYPKNQKKEILCKSCMINYDPQTQLMKTQLTEKDIRDMADLRLQGLMRCPSCTHWVERTEGCNDMICKCNYNFCYYCGQNMRINHKKCGNNQDFIQQKIRNKIDEIAKDLKEGDDRYNVYQNMVLQSQKGIGYQAGDPNNDWW